MQPANSPKHIVLHAHPVAWGHNKPLTTYAVLVLEAHPDVVLTYLASTPLFPKIMGELERLPRERYKAIQSRLNVIDISGPIRNLTKPVEGFAPAFAALYKSESVTCLSSGKTISGLSRPTLAIIDPFLENAFESIRAIAANSVPILSWLTIPAGALIRLHGPESLGGNIEPVLDTPEGRAVWKAKVLSDEKLDIPKRGVSENEIVDGIPGLPATYEHEWFPQSSLLEDVVARHERTGAIYVRESDGMICVSSSAYEPEAVAAAKKWFESTGRVWYNAGPLAIQETLPAKSDTDTDVIKFLDRMQSEYGEKSLIYLSFGTFAFPIVPDKLWAILEELIATRTPFIFAHPSPFAKIPDEIKTMIADSEIGMELPWSPQEVILSHPVTGWFITHGGWNSVQEAFFHRVPLIFWPYRADQPYNAMLLTLKHKAAFELVEVRSGERGARIPYRYKDAATSPSFTVEGVKAELRMVLDKAKGEQGKMVRQNFEALADAMGRAWKEGGESKCDLDAMFTKFVN